MTTWHIEAAATASDGAISFAVHSDAWRHHAGVPEIVLQEAVLRILRPLLATVAEGDPDWRARTRLQFDLTLSAAKVSE